MKITKNKPRRLIGAAVSATVALCLTTLAPVTPAAAAGKYNSVYTPIDTDYPIPPGDVRYVDPNGSDTNDGSAARPYQTLKKAHDSIADGGTIVMRSGIYRQPHTFITKQNVTVQADKHAEVWLKGSRVVTNWTPSGSMWKAAGWAPDFCRDCSTNPNEGIAAWPEQVFIDDVSLTQVGTKQEVTKNKFYVDTVERAIYIGNDPAGKTVEASEYERALTVTGANFKLLGINIAQYAPHQQGISNDDMGSLGMIYTNAGATNLLVENCLIVQSASHGLSSSGSSGVVIRNSEFRDNGANGIGGNRMTNYTVENNTFFQNNAAGFETKDCGDYCGIADIKITHSENITFRNNFIANTPANGFWCDEGCINTTITNNFVSRSVYEGIFYEVSSHAIIAGNIVEGSAGGGITIGGSDHVQIYNNTLSRNRFNLRIYEDPRINGCNKYSSAEKKCLANEPWSQSKGLSWDTKSTEVYNNIASRPRYSDNTAVRPDGNQATPFFTAMSIQQNGTVVIAPDMFNNVDYNAYWRDAKESWLWVWDKNRENKDDHTIYTGEDAIAKIRAGTGFETHGIDQFGNINTNFVTESISDLQKSDYHLTPASPLRNAGRVLPADVAAALGWPAGVPVDMGALNNPWMKMPLGNSPIEPAICSTLISPIYQVINPALQTNLLTASENEAANAAKYGFTDSRGAPFNASLTPVDGLVAVHRLYNAATNDFVWITDPNEVTSAIQKYGYADNGINFYASPSASTCTQPVYRFIKGNIHRFAVSQADRNDLAASDWKSEGVAFHANVPSDPAFCSALLSPIYQVVNPALQTNLLTASENEAANAAKYGFTDSLGAPFNASLTPADGLVAAHRLYNAATNDFVWITDPNEVTSAIQKYGYADNGINFYVSPSASNCTQPVYRFAKGTIHRFAVSQADRSDLTASGWNAEGVVFHAGFR
ncbi:MAG: right-handed parallel beta-helix repeat-containing protein [Desulfovibrionaceae bacterium]|nr:right-handed parallel beta-helix repeat-containing protein [Desulfovibrionaceae bacterium]